MSRHRPRIEDLVHQYGHRLYRYAYRLTHQSADAEDLVQETYLLAQRKLHQLRDPDRAMTWLFRILRNRWIRQCDRAASKNEQLAESLDQTVSGPEVDLDVSLDAQTVMTQLNALPDEFRDPLLLFYFEQFRYREIAEILDCPVGTVMSRLSRGKALLRQQLTNETDDELSEDASDTQARDQVKASSG